MNLFFNNLQILTKKTSSASAANLKVAEALRRLMKLEKYQEGSSPAEGAQRSFLIKSSKQSNWISIYEQGKWSHNDLEFAAVAEGLSVMTESPVINISVFANCGLQLALYQNGSKIDTYNNLPHYLGKSLDAKESSQYQGNPKLWQELLTEGMLPAGLRQIWDYGYFQARDYLAELSHYFGWDFKYCQQGFEAAAGSLETADETSILLSFTSLAKANPSRRNEDKGATLPILEFVAPPLPRVTLSEEAVFRTGFTIKNSGGAGKGLTVGLYGPAISDKFIAPVRLCIRKHKEKKELVTEFTEILTVNREKVWVAYFSDLYLTEAPRLNLVESLMSNKPRDPQDDLYLSWQGKILNYGQTRIFYDLVADANSQQERLKMSQELTLSPPRSRKPCNYFSRRQSDYYLQQIEQPNYLMGGLVLERGWKKEIETLLGLFEKWHHVITEEKHEKYKWVLKTESEESRENLSIASRGFLTSKQWLSLPQTLPAAQEWILLLDYPIRNNIKAGEHIFENTSGIMFCGQGDFFAGLRGHDFAPHLFFWYPLETSSGRDRYESIHKFIWESFRELAEKISVAQGFLTTWGLPPGASFQNNLYEQALGIEGQSAWGRLWCNQYLRVLAPNLWLGSKLQKRIDLAELREVANLESVNANLLIKLDPLKQLADLEKVLTPILPTVTKWQEANRELWQKRKMQIERKK